MRARVAAIAALVAAPILSVPVLGQSPSPSPMPAIPAGPVVQCPAIALVGDGTIPPASSPASTTPIPLASIAPAPDARSMRRWSGTWTPMPAAPIAPRTGAATDLAVWANRIYVWGGHGADGRLLADGAWYDVAAGTWEVLPDAGLMPRERFGFDADAQGLTIWGGVDADGQPLGDGARFGSLADRLRWEWVPLPPAPLTAGPASISGDINVTLVVTPGEQAGDPFRWAVLDWDTLDDQESNVLSWDEPSDPDIRTHGQMAAPSLPAGIAYEFASARDAAMLLSYQADGTAVASWFTRMWPGTWSTPERVPLPATGACPGIAIPSFGWIRTAADGSPVGLIADAGGNGTWQALPQPPSAAATGGMLVGAPGHLIAADGLVAWDAAAERWRTLPPLPDGPRTGVSAAWSYGQLYLWGGQAADGSLPSTGWIFTPDVPAGALRLPGGYPRGYSDCGGVGTYGVWRLRGDPDDPLLVWFQQDGERMPTHWPDGYVVRFRGGTFVVLDPEGHVVAREGQTYRERERPGDLRPCWTGHSADF